MSERITIGIITRMEARGLKGMLSDGIRLVSTVQSARFLVEDVRKLVEDFSPERLVRVFMDILIFLTLIRGMFPVVSAKATAYGAQLSAISTKQKQVIAQAALMKGQRIFETLQAPYPGGGAVTVMAGAPSPGIAAQLAALMPYIQIAVITFMTTWWIMAATRKYWDASYRKAEEYKEEQRLKRIVANW